jgi:hypothetical protein
MTPFFFFFSFPNLSTIEDDDDFSLFITSMVLCQRFLKARVEEIDTLISF